MGTIVGALSLKLALGAAMNDLNNRRKDRIVSSYADDALMSCPGEFWMSGTRKCKPAIKQCFDKS